MSTEVSRTRRAGRASLRFSAAAREALSTPRPRRGPDRAIPNGDSRALTAPRAMKPVLRTTGQPRGACGLPRTLLACGKDDREVGVLQLCLESGFGGVPRPTRSLGSDGDVAADLVDNR
jgi:hypothetical protein